MKAEFEKLNPTEQHFVRKGTFCSIICNKTFIIHPATLTQGYSRYLCEKPLMEGIFVRSG